MESEAAMAVKSKNAEKRDADGKGGAPGAAGAAPEHGGDGAEVAEELVQVVERAAAIDVAKGSGMVCTRVPGSRPDRRRQKVWQVTATYGEVIALMDHLRCEGIQRLVLESTSDYWRIWYYLAEAAGLEVWLVNARDVKHLPGRGKSDRLDCVWHCKLNERGMLRRSFVPPEAVRDLRALTRTRARLAQDQARHQNRVEKILEDALLKISVVISDLFGASGRRFLDALVAGERSPAALAALGDTRLKATRTELEDALTGRFRDIHAFEISTHLRIIDTINEEITRLDEAIGQQLALVPRTAPACTACGLAGGGHAPGCAGEGRPVLGLAERLDEVTGVGECNARAIIAELGTDPSQFPTPGHAAAWARLTSRTMQSGETARNGRTGKGNRYLRGALGQSAMAAARTDTRLGAMYRRIARKRGKQKAIVAVSRVICEIAWILICDPGARFEELGPDYYSSRSPARQTRDKIREIERLNPGKKVILADADPPRPGPQAGPGAGRQAA
ncbi:MAG TPA: IS110 family transposase [Streptosporangiaceae bacterium]|nr:IS110 family transposase [Streptosporangiaceae bacterium]